MTRVVIAGAGLAGVACAHTLGAAGVEVDLIDRNDYHQFQPLLYQVATSQLPAEDVARPLRALFDELPSVTVHQGEIADVDGDGVTLADGTRLTGHYLVLAVGAVANFFGTPGADEHAFPLYSVVDAERLRRHMSRLLSMNRPIDDVVVVGGGPTGVEIAGALAEMFAALHGVGHPAGSTRVILANHGKELLAPFSAKTHAYAKQALTDRGVDVRLGVGVTAVGADSVTLSDGCSVSASTVIWAGGEQAAPVLSNRDDARGHGGRVNTEPDLRVTGNPYVFAIGDAANITDRQGTVLPQLGSVAQQSGKWAAENIVRDASGESTKPFHYRDKGIMAMIGRGAAVAEVGAHHHHIEGPVAFAAWLGVHAALLNDAHCRVDAFLSWAWDYFDRDHAAQIECHSTPRRIAWRDDVEPTIVVD